MNIVNRFAVLHESCGISTYPYATSFGKIPHLMLVDVGRGRFRAGDAVLVIADDGQFLCMMHDGSLVVSGSLSFEHGVLSWVDG